MSWTVTLQGYEAKEPITIIKPDLIIKNHESLGTLKLLKYLDPYGDTFFNSLQMDDLIEDLETLKNIEPIRLIDEIILLAQRCQQSVDTFVAFYGD